MEMKAALIETLGSRGWAYVSRFAETIVRELESKAIAEEDDVKGNSLRRDARGARKFKDELLRRLEIGKNVEVDGNNFLDVATE